MILNTLSVSSITEGRPTRRKLQESEQLLALLSAKLLTAQENERKRIAMELHDGLGQSLTAIKFKVESFLREIRLSRKKVRTELLKDVIPMIQHCVREIHRVQSNLRPSVLDDLGILPTISWLCRNFQSNYPNIHILQDLAVEEDEISDEIKLIIYRILQEALNNITKHSHGDCVRLSLEKKENALELIIQDNGRGFDPLETLSNMDSGGGLGLISMKERAEHAGGLFFIESEMGKGTVIRVTWPVESLPPG